MIKDLEKIVGSCFCIEQATLLETLSIIIVLIASSYAIFKGYGVVALITWYLTRYFTRKAGVSDEY